MAPDSLLVDKVEKIYPAPYGDLIQQALNLVRADHKGIFSSALKVTELLVDQEADGAVVIASLLAPLLWDHSLTLGEINRQFGPEISTILDNFILPPPCRTDTDSHHRQDAQLLVTSLSQDVRETVLLLAFRLIDLESHLAQPDQLTISKAQETRHYYVPIASRLNLGMLRRRLEDVAFRILEPQRYQELEQQVTPIQAEDSDCLEILKQATARLLRSHDIEGEVQGRIKSLYSIHCKMERKGASLNKILDRIGLRIIVSTVPDCYTVLGLLHCHFQPVPGSFDDYIGLPKDNGYQSLHTCVYPVRDISHKPIEFQIRTALMHKEAEYGVAAHWRYKQDASALTAADRQRAQWLKGLRNQHGGVKTAKDFIHLLYQQVFEDQTVIFGPAGQIVRLPENPTVRDYVQKAYSALTAPLTVQVNGQSVGLDHVLQDGDSVEVIASGDQGQGKKNI